MNGGMAPMSTVQDGVSSTLSRINRSGDLEYIAGCWGVDENGKIPQGCTRENGWGEYSYQIIYTEWGMHFAPLPSGEYELAIWARGTMISRTPFFYDGQWIEVTDPNTGGPILLEYSPVQGRVKRSLIDLPEDGGIFNSSLSIGTGKYGEPRKVRVQHIVQGAATNWFSTSYGLGEEVVTLTPGKQVSIVSPDAEVSADLPKGGWTCIYTQVSDAEDSNTVFLNLTACARKVGKKVVFPIHGTNR